MNIDRRANNSIQKSNQKKVKEKVNEKEIFLTERGKLQSENIINQKFTNNYTTQKSLVNQIIPISENKKISLSKKQNNNQIFGSTQKKLFTNSSLKNLEININNSKNNYKTSNFNLVHNNIGSPNTYSNMNNNNLNISKFGVLPNSNTNSTSNLCLNIKEQDKTQVKEQEISNPLKNSKEINQDTTLQKNSLLSTGNLLNTNQELLKDNKTLMSPHNFINLLPNSNHNSVNNISTNSDSNHIKVVVRFRPMNTVENEMLEKKIGFKCVNFKSLDTIEVMNSFNHNQAFTFDRVYNDKTTQPLLYSETAKPLITDILKGYNGTIFTYGQSGSGKTYTMYGGELLDEETQGVIPRAINEIFEFIDAEENKEIRFELKFSMLEIYQEQLYDLLNPECKSSDLKIKEHQKKGIYVENLSEVYISSQEEFLMLIHEAERARIVKETGLNKCSSRSHLLFQLHITQKFPDDTERHGLLNLIDLAGSEKVSKTHAIGETLNEAKKINSSLSILGKVISILATSSGDYVPYRESKLTRILQDSLGGNSKTILIVNCSIHSYNADETIYTLNFAKRAKKIKNKVKINIKHSPEQLEAIIEVLTNKLRLANEEINKLKGLRAASPNKSTSVQQTSNEEIHTSLFKNLNSLNNHVCSISDSDNNLNDLLKTNLNMNNNLSNLNKNEGIENPDILKNVKNLQSIIKTKDEEISLLNDKIEVLHLECKNLQEKIDNMHKQNNLDEHIENLDISLKENLENLKDILTSNKKDEIELLTEKMTKINKFYKNLEENYLHLFNKITDFNEIEFEKKLTMINNDNFGNFFENTNDEYDIFNKNNNKNLNVIINNFQNFNNFNGNNIKYNEEEKKFEIDKNGKKDLNNDKESNIEVSFDKNINNKINNIDSNYKNSVNLLNDIKTINKSKSNKRISFFETKNNLIINKIFNKKLISPSAPLNLNSKSNNHNVKNIKNNPKDQIKINNCIEKNLNLFNSTKQMDNKEVEINSSSANLNYNSKTNINNIDNFIQNDVKNIQKHVDANIDNKMIDKNTTTMEFYKNINNNDLKIFNIAKEAKIAREELNSKFKTPEEKNEDKKENQEDALKDSDSKYKRFGLNLYDFNLNCDEFFRKLELQLTSKNKGDNSELIILSYKKLFMANKIFTVKIFDEFLKRKDNNKYDSFMNLNQKFQDNFNSKESFNEKQTMKNLLFSPESNNFDVYKKTLKLDTYMTPKADYLIKKEEEKEILIKESDKTQATLQEINYFSNRSIRESHLTNNTKDKQSKNSNVLDFDNQKINMNSTNINKNDYNNNYKDINNINNNFKNIDSDYFVKMKDCIMKLMFKIIYYENINFDMLNRLSIDLKIFHLKSKVADQINTKLEKILNIFSSYLEVLDEIKKIKYQNQYEEQAQQNNNQNLNLSPKLEFLKFDNLDNKNSNLAFIGESNTHSNYNVKNSNKESNKNIFFTENSPSRIPNNYNTTGKKDLLRASLLLPEGNFNPLLMQQPINLLYRNSKINTNNNIIKNITKRSSLVLNNLGFGLAFRKSVLEPSGFSHVICPKCNNYFNNSGISPTKPFYIGNNEEENLLIKNTINNKNIQVDSNEIKNSKMEAEKKLNFNLKFHKIDENSYQNDNSFITQFNLTSENKINSKIKNIKNTKNNSIENKSIDKDLMLSNMSVNSIKIDYIKTRSKNVSFYLNDEEKRNLESSPNSKCNKKIDKEFQNTYLQKVNNTIEVDKNGKVVRKNILKTKNVFIQPKIKENVNDISEKNDESNNISREINESDATFDNFNLEITPSIQAIESNREVIQNINLESNKNMNLNSKMNENSDNFNSKISNYDTKSNKTKNPYIKQNTIHNNEIKDLEIRNLKSHWEGLKKSIISTNSNNNFNLIKDENLSELKLAKKETLLYKNCFDSITSDFKNLKSNCKNMEKIHNQEFENFKNLKEAEILKFSKALEIHNELFLQQIKIKDIKIKQLASLIDQLVENQNNSILNNLNNTENSLNQNNTVVFTEDHKRKFEYLLEKKNFILNNTDFLNEDNSDISLMKLTDVLLNQEGTATKKLDYITIELNDNPELIKFKYGSGLGQKLPTRSPLYRNFITTFAGDENDELNITEISD